LSSYPDKFDVVVAADVIYEVEQVAPLLDTVAALLKGDLQFSYYIFTIANYNNFKLLFLLLL